MLLMRDYKVLVDPAGLDKPGEMVNKVGGFQLKL